MTSLVHTSLGEVAKLNPTFKAKTVSPEELVDFLPMSAVSAELTTVRAIEQRPLCEVQKGYTNFAHGDVLLAKITPCFENGKIAFAQLNTAYGFGSTEFHVIRANSERLDGRYLVHFLRRDEIRVDGARNMTGSAGQRRVPKHYLESLSIPLPSLPEQRRIAAILNQADALRARRREALAQLDSLTQSIFIEMFGDPHTNPKDWPLKTLKELGKIKTGGTPSSGKKGMFGGPIPFVTPGDLESDDLVKRTVTEQGASESGTVRAGATLVCCIGTIGKMSKANERSAFNQQINAIEWGDAVDDDFGVSELRFFKSKLASRATATTLPILNKSSFGNFTIPVPPIELQREFSRRFNSIDTLKLAHRVSLAQMDALFASLQHRAFKGEL